MFNFSSDNIIMKASELSSKKALASELFTKSALVQSNKCIKTIQQWAHTVI